MFSASARQCMLLFTVPEEFSSHCCNNTSLSILHVEVLRKMLDIRAS